MTNLPKFKIGNLEMNLIQGGMGVGISEKSLASAVANCGGAGIIASVGLGLLNNYSGNYIEANQQALADEIQGARKKTNGIIGVNIMCALTDYKQLVQTSVNQNVDLIISGAGIPKDLPGLVQEENPKKEIKLIPIVSSQRLAKLITKRWFQKYGKIPDAFIVEGPKAGGHLGFKYENLKSGKNQSLEQIAKEVIEFANSQDFNHSIPVIVAGGIYTGQDLRKYQELGATGVQMATRFVTTAECDASDKFKQEYLRAKKQDIVLIKSPVGMPGRAIKNNFLEKIAHNKRVEFQCEFNCLRSCNPKTSPYCIAQALVEAQKGNLKNGFAFAGVNAYKCTEDSCTESGEFISVKTLMQRISDEHNN